MNCLVSKSQGCTGGRNRGGAWLLPLLLLFALYGCLSSENGEQIDGDTEEAGEHQVTDPCADIECPQNSHCDSSGDCICDTGYEKLGEHCVAVVDGDTDIDGDEDADSFESEDDEELSEGEQSTDGDSDEETEEIDSSETEFDVEMLPGCAIPQAPTLSIIHLGAVLTFTSSQHGTIETGKGSADSEAPEAWSEQSQVTMDRTGEVKVFSRLIGEDCQPRHFSFVYEVRQGYPPMVGEDGTTAIAMDDEKIVGWATEVDSIVYGEDVGDGWQTPEKALGEAMGTSFDIVSLGRGGEITLVFDPPIADGPGYDFAVFENSFSDGFLELAYVEASSDGETFLRFDNAYLGDALIDGYGSHDTGLIGSLAGKYRQGFGDPYDLAVMANRPEVESGLFDPEAVRYIRIVDIIGDGSVEDSFGNVIYDPYPTVDSVGFDLDAVGVLHH